VEKHSINDCGVITDPEEIRFTIGHTTFRIRYAKLADGFYRIGANVTSPMCGIGCAPNIDGEKYKTLEKALKDELDNIEKYCKGNNLACDRLRQKAYDFLMPSLF
jgi:hypothetical protein